MDTKTKNQKTEKQQKEQDLEKNTETNGESAVAKKRQRVYPTTLNEAKQMYSPKILLNINKINSTNTDPHLRLTYLLFKNIINYISERETFSSFSVLQEYCNRTNMFSYFDNTNVKNILRDILGDNFDENNLSKYYKALIGVVELININILNYSVYVDPTKFGKHKVFTIIETVIYTQMMPFELNKYELDFKQKMKQDIDVLKASLKLKSTDLVPEE